MTAIKHGVRKFLSPLEMELIRTLQISRHAKAEFVVSILLLMLFFFGARFANEATGKFFIGNSSTFGMLFAAWIVVLGSASGLPSEILEDARHGTLVHLFVSKVGFIRIVVSRYVVQVAYSLVFALAALGFLYVGTGNLNGFDLVTVSSILFIITASAGFSFALIGNILLLKSDLVTKAIAYLGILVIMSVPFEHYSAIVAFCLPIVSGMFMLRSHLSHGPWNVLETTMVLVSSLFWFAVGLQFLLFAIRRCRRNGNLLEV
jgi:hypothetical protein